MNTDHLLKTSHIVSGQRYGVYTLQKPTQRKWLRKKRNKQIKKNKDFFQRKQDTIVWQAKLSDKQKSLSYLDYLQTVQSFYFSDYELYSRTLSEVTSMQVNTLQGN